MMWYRWEYRQVLIELDLLRIPEVIAECNETVCGTYQNFSCRVEKMRRILAKLFLDHGKPKFLL